MPVDQAFLKELAAQLRVDSIRATTAAGSGHPTSSLSAADLMAVLLAKHLRYDWNDPHRQNNHRLIFSKGHASPLLYAMYKAAGVITDQELLSLRKLGSRLEGHPKPERKDKTQGLPWVDVATGSLGQGLPAAVGMALVGEKIDNVPFRVWVLLGDSEMAEGSVWEGFDKAGYYGLSCITAILDMNRLGQQSPTEYGWHGEIYADRGRAFGWHVIEIDGHNLEEIDQAYQQCDEERHKPTLIVARTVKGFGVKSIANEGGWHGKALNEEQAKGAIEELGGERSIQVEVQKPKSFTPQGKAEGPQTCELKRYELGSKESTRKAFGDALASIGEVISSLVVLDGEVGNSTYTDAFEKAIPERFFQMFIAEQQMVSAAVGMAVLGKTVVAATFASFLTRAFDQIRMAAVTGVRLSLCGSHVGVSIGEDGPSQMGLEDMAMMRAVHGSSVIYPCDPNQTVRLTELMLKTPGISYMRTTRGSLPTIYSGDDSFVVGGSKTVKASEHDEVTVLAAGVTVHEALKAYETLKKDGIAIRVIDLYSVKPVDAEALFWAAQDTGCLITVEDHWPEGGLGDAVLEAFSGTDRTLPHLEKLAVREMPGSGTPAELLNAAGIDAEAIAEAVRRQLSPAKPKRALVL